MELSLLPIESAPGTPTDPTSAELPGSTESAAIAAPPGTSTVLDRAADPAAPEAPALAACAAEARSTSASDRYLHAATREYERGGVDRPLWERAVELAGGDHAVAVPGYLKARATALRLADRGRTPSAADSRKPVATSEPAAGAANDDAGGAAAASRRRRAPRLRGWPIAAIAAGAVVVAAATWFLTALRDDAGASSAANQAVPAAAAPAAAPATAPKAPAAAQVDASAEREAKVAELLRAGNWNVLVLHAAEWTRKEPENARAWKHLSVGYANLKQTDDALAAAERAAILAPGEPGTWTQLGRMNLSAGRPEAALQAFEQAVAQDGRDVASLVLVGRVNAELGRLPQAKAAFDRALAVSPDDTDALCGELRLAQKQGRGRDAEATLRELKRGAKECPADSAPAVASMAVVPAAAAAPAGRAR